MLQKFKMATVIYSVKLMKRTDGDYDFILLIIV